MADTSTGAAVHLTKIDFDISDIATQLNSIQEQLKATANAISNGEEYKIKMSSETEKVKADLAAVGTTAKKVSTQTKGLQAVIADLTNADTKLVETTILKNKKLEETGAILTVTSNNYTKTTTQLAKVGEEYEYVSQKISDGAKANQTAIEKEQNAITSQISTLDGYLFKIQELQQAQQTVTPSIVDADEYKMLDLLADEIVEVRNNLALNNTTSTQAKEIITDLTQQYTTYARELKETTSTLSTGEKGLTSYVEKLDGYLFKIKELQATQTNKYSDIVSTDAYKNTDSLSTSMSNLQKEIENGNITVTQAKEKYNELVEQYTTYARVLKETTSTEQTLQTQRNSFYKTNLNQIDYEIQQRESASKKFSELLKAQLTEEQATQTSQQKTIATLDSLIFKTEEYKKTIANASGDVSTEYQEKINALLQEQNTLYSQIQAQDGPVTDAQNQKIVTLNQNLTTLKGEFTRAKTAQTAFTSQSTKVDTLIAKYKDLATQIQQASSSAGNTTLSTEVQKTVDALNGIQTEALNRGYFTDDDILKVSEYNTKLSTLKTNFTETNKASNNFLTTITDKARWLIAFYIVNQIREGFVALLDTLEDTEMAVVELQRVLGTDVDTEAIQSSLYSIAGEYGRTFEEVSETATLFAQAGYDMAEVLTLTESTMLAVNTAELEVTDATTGLIAVMSQFNLTADDMQSIIDKINITADNFPVTSEKIVTALQRAGGAATSANVSFEETVAIITALSKATGRTGESIGTAVNSLITYTQKASSLEVFASLSDEMEDTITKFQTGALSIVDVWQSLSNELTGLSSEQSGILEQLYSSDEFQEFADELELEATEVTDSIKEVYSTAGTARQNYFIGLLNEMNGIDSTYTQALANMTEAQGYSLSENEQYVETLTSKYNQLTIELKELAVQLGNQGITNALKWFVDLGISATNLVEQLGGIRTISTLVFAIFAQLKAQQIDKFFKNIVNTNLIVNWRIFVTEVKEATVGMSKLKTASTAVGMAIKSISISTWIGLIATALSMLSQISENIEAKWEALREKASEMTQEFTDMASSVQELTKQYIELTSQIELSIEAREELKTVTSELSVITSAQLDEEIEKREYNLQLLTDEIKRKYDLATLENEQVYEKAVSEVYSPNSITYTSVGEISNLTRLSDEFASIYETIGEINGININERGFVKFWTDPDMDLYEQKEALEEVLLLFKDIPEEIDIEASVEFERIKEAVVNYLDEIDETLEKWEPTLADMSKSEEMLASATISQEIARIQSIENIDEQEQAYNDLIESVQGFVYQMAKTDPELLGFDYNLETVKESLTTLIKETFPEFSGIIEDNEDDVKTISQEYQTLTETLDTLSNQKDFLQSVEDEFDEFGKISLDTFNDILDTYPQLAEELWQYQSGLISSTELIEKMSEAYEVDYENYVKSLKSKLSYDTDYYNELMTTQSEFVDNFSESYGIDLNNFESLAEAKHEVQKQLISELQSMWITFYENVYGGAYGEAFDLDTLKYNYNEIVRWAGVDSEDAKELAKVIAEIENIEKVLNGIDEISFDGINFETLNLSLEGVTGSATETVDELNDKISEINDIYDPQISLLEKELTLMELQGASTEDQVANLLKQNDLLHEQAETIREADGELADTVDLSIQYMQNIEDINDRIDDTADKISEINDLYDPQISSLDKELSLMELQGASTEDQVANLLKQNDLLHEQAEAIREVGGSTADTVDLSIQYMQNIKDINDRIDDTADKISSLDKELSLMEYQGASTEDQVANLKAQQDLLHEQAEAIREVGGSTADTADLSIKWWEIQEKINDLMKELADDTLEQQQDAINSQIESYEDLKDSIEDAYNAEIDMLNEVQEENERIRTEEDYLDSLADTEKSLAEASARSGVEYREAESEAEEDIQDLQSDWQDQLEDWATEDAIDVLEALRDKELELMDTVIEGLETSLEELQNGVYDTVEEAEQAFTEITGSFDENFIEPIQDSTTQLFASDILTIAETSASDIYTSYSENFIEKLREDLMSIFEEAEELKNDYLSSITELTLAQQSALAAATSSTSNSYSNNNTQTVYISGTSGSATNSISNATSSVFSINTML